MLGMPLFRLIQEESNTDWAEMYKVFNMGHRMEFYTDENTAADIIAISQQFGIEARIIGYTEIYDGKKLSISSDKGNFVWEQA